MTGRTMASAWCLLGLALILAACQEEAAGERAPDKSAALETESLEPVTGEPPPVLTAEEYAKARRGTREGELDSATMLVGFLEYVIVTSGNELTEDQKQDRALGYEVLGGRYGICDSAIKAVEDNSITRYIDQDRLEVVREIYDKCDGRHGYIDTISGEHTLIPNW